MLSSDTARKGLYQTSANVKNADFFNLTINAPVTIKEWWIANNTLTAFNNQYHTTGLEGLELNANKTSLYFSSNHNFTLPKDFAAQVSGNYRSSMVYGTLNIGSEYGVDLGLSKSFASKNQKHLNLILNLNNNQSQVQTYLPLTIYLITLVLLITSSILLK